MKVVHLKYDLHLTKICRSVGSKKRTCYLLEQPWSAGRTFLSGWSEGSREEYFSVDKEYRAAPLLGVLDPNRTGDPFKQRFLLPDFPNDAIAIVRTGIFCGRTSTPFVWLRLPPKPLT